ncbi:MAG: YceI family protein [Bryobacterales bacterium]|jgi:polyisoprenoid-binding protein YceI|nr:YceI family protein [Bryobacterales bacterium]
MFRFLNTLMLTSVLAVGALAADYKIDPAHSSANFSVTHMGLSKVRGGFGNVQGIVSYDPANLAATKVEATVDVSTVSTNDPKRDGHLKSPDFFEAEKFPTMKFVSSKVEKAGNGLKVTGDLTIKGVTKQAVLNIDGPTDEIKDMRGMKRRAAAATTRINRKDFGITFNRVLDTGGLMISDEVDITIDIQFAAAAQ